MTFAVTNTFTNGTLADADEVNANFTEVVSELNGTTDTSTSVQRWIVVGSTTLGSDASTITVNSIPANYKWLRVVLRYGHNTTGADTTFMIRFNADSTNGNYIGAYLGFMDGAHTGSSFSSTGCLVASGRDGQSAINGYSEIMINEENTSLTKAVNFYGGQSSTFLTGQGIWTNTSDAITSIVAVAPGNFKSGSKMSVWGSVN